MMLVEVMTHVVVKRGRCTNCEESSIGCEDGFEWAKQL